MAREEICFGKRDRGEQYKKTNAHNGKNQNKIDFEALPLFESIRSLQNNNLLSK